jgi:hypothetical protein
MASLAPPILTLERFAELCELVDDGFVKHAAMLAAAGLDERTWLALRDAWLPRLAAGDEPELATRFGHAYAAARRHRLGCIVMPPRVLTTPVGMRIDADDTEETSARSVVDGDPAAPVDAPQRVSPPLAPVGSRSHAPDPTEQTIPAAHVPPPVRVPPLPPPPTGRRQRLVRFDTQTGAQLPCAYWIDEPTPPR